MKRQSKRRSQGRRCLCEPLEVRAYLAGDVVINEFLASNATNITDEDGAHSDWMELHNTTASAIDLTGYHLTDLASNPSQWTFPAVSLPAGGYLIVFASSKNRTNPAANLHTNFNISASGEYLGLTRPDNTVEYEYSPSFPAQASDISYGLGADLVTKQYFSTPTPGATNAPNAASAAEPQFDVEHGFFTSSFPLTMTTATTDTTIRYTTDGSAPTETTGAVYSGPITISTTTVVRAAAFKPGLSSSAVQTQTFLFASAIVQQPANPAGFPDVWGGPGSSEIAQAADYQVDPDVTTNPAYSGELVTALTSIPTLSLVMPIDAWFSPTTGIYSNRSLEGSEWERPVSIEYFNAGAVDDFQIDAGVRIQGGSSTTDVFNGTWSTPKQSMSLRFKDVYGAAQLVAPLFSDGSVQSFEQLILDAHYNYTWPHKKPEQQARADYIRDQLVADLQIAADSYAPHGNYVHLYLNGLYWGVYNLHERPNESFAAAYLGGDKLQYDVIKHEPIDIVAGDNVAYLELHNRAAADLSQTANYQAVTEYLDIPDFIDYMAVNFFAGNTDWAHHNWYAARKRETGAKFHFFSWDAEHTLKSPTDDVTHKNNPGGPTYLHQQLRANAEYRQLFADRVQRLFFNDGALTSASALQQFLERVDEIDSAIIMESARWGDVRRSNPYTRDVEWQAEIDFLQNDFFPGRTQTVLNQLRHDNLASTLATPIFNQRGGRVSADFSVVLSAPGGTIYYTLDGSDPRLEGGGISPSAIQYSGPFTLPDSRLVRVRAKNGEIWSAIDAASFVWDAFGLRVTEKMFNPPAGGSFTKELYEFLELQNVSQQLIDLEGIQFTTGITATLPNFVLQPGQFAVLSPNLAAFAERYGTSVVPVGTYTGALSNSGEQIVYRDALGAAIQDYTFVDAWHPSADGAGKSLVIKRSLAPLAAWSTASGWRPSDANLGAPGAADPDPNANAALAGQVFLDANGDGIQNDGGAGVAGTIVRLYSAGVDSQIGGGDDLLLNSQTTTGSGDYTFSGLLPDSYYLEFVPPTSHAFSLQDQTADTDDSDANPTTGRTAVFPLVTNQTDSTQDAGLVLIPEIAIFGLGLEIANGDTSPFAADNTHFGVTPLNTTKGHNFVIVNQGAAPLVLPVNPVQITGVNPNDFVVVQPIGTTIGPNESASFRIEFTPEATGLRTATVTVGSNDADETSYTFTIQGSGGFEQIIDDGDPGYARSGPWTDSNDAAAFQTDFDISTRNNIGDKAIWTFSGLASGQYLVYASWVAGADRSTTATYKLFDGSNREAKTNIDQRVAANDSFTNGIWWEQLPTMSISSGTLKVKLHAGASGNEVADAIRIVKVETQQTSQTRLASLESNSSDVSSNGTTYGGDASIESVTPAANSKRTESAKTPATSSDENRRSIHRRGKATDQVFASTHFLKELLGRSRHF